MILDARNRDEVPACVIAETVIVGAGTVGLFLATSLARANMPVVLVESGGRVANTDRNGDTAESLGRPHTGVLFGRAMGLGGTSVLWGGQLAEFEETDLEREGSIWPLAHKELRRWYDQIYEVLGINRWLRTKIDEQSIGEITAGHPNVERFLTVWLPQPNFAKLFHRALVSGQLIKVILHATVKEIKFEGDRARAVLAISSEGRPIRIIGKTFVFAGGTIANNRFFLTSQRISDAPWKSNDLIGKYFQDHLTGKVAHVDILNERRFRAMFENGFVNKIKFQPKLRLTCGARTRVPSGVCGFFSFDSELQEKVANIKRLVRTFKSGITFSELRTIPGDIWMLKRAFGPLIVRYIRDHRVLAFFDKALELHVQGEQLPISNSRIRLLDGTQGPDGLFRVGVDWQVDGREVSSIHKFAEEADSYLRALGIAQLRIDPLLGRGGREFMDKLVDNAHQCGGLRMASTPSAGVTDDNCRVWHTANVYVAGAAVFPTSSHANCTLTALALTARLANALGNRQ
jgi:choline dehydrogenase-like flavoprotein